MGWLTIWLVSVFYNEMVVGRFDDVECEAGSWAGAKDVCIRWLITEDKGAPNFLMRMFEIAPGGYTPRHRHDYEHEVFILEGNGKVFCEGKEYEVTAGHYLLIKPNEEHQFINTGDVVWRFLCLIPKK